MKFQFNYKNDTIQVDVGKWIRGVIFRQRTTDYYYSTNYSYPFLSFEQYWKEVGKRNALVQFISSKAPGKYGPKYYSMHEIIQKVAQWDLGENCGVILSNVDQSRLDRLLHMFAGVSALIFRQGDVIVFPTNSKESAYKMTESIPSSLADVCAFADGCIFHSNDEVQ